MVTLVPAYSALFGLVFVALSVRTLLLRRRFKVAIGSGEAVELERAARVHANFAEYVPLALMLLLFMEMQGLAGWWLHVLCIALLLGRLAHAYGVSQVDENYRYRVAGMVATLTVIVSASLRLVGTAVA